HALLGAARGLLAAREAVPRRTPGRPTSRPRGLIHKSLVEGNTMNLPRVPSDQDTPSAAGARYVAPAGRRQPPATGAMNRAPTWTRRQQSLLLAATVVLFAACAPSATSPAPAPAKPVAPAATPGGSAPAAAAPTAAAPAQTEQL